MKRYLSLTDIEALNNHYAERMACENPERVLRDAQAVAAEWEGLAAWELTAVPSLFLEAVTFEAIVSIDGECWVPYDVVGNNLVDWLLIEDQPP